MTLKLMVRQKTRVPKGIVNEDAKLVDRARNIFIVADGVGGNPAADEASHLAVTDAYQIFRGYEPHIRAGRIKEAEISDYIAETIRQTNDAVSGLSESVERFREGEKKAATTLLFCYFFKNHIYIGNIGDSCAYHLRKRTLTRLTKDASFVEEKGDEAARKLQELSGFGGLTKYLGQEKAAPDITIVRLWKNDTVLLTTDGLTKLLFDHEIADILYQAPFETCLHELTRAVDDPRALAKHYASFKSITPEQARADLKNKDSITAILLKTYRGN